MTEAMAEWRKKNPRARRVNPVAIELNTGCRRIYGCICGSSVSMSSKWPMTAAVKNFIAEHNRRCQPKQEGSVCQRRTNEEQERREDETR